MDRYNFTTKDGTPFMTTQWNRVAVLLGFFGSILSSMADTATLKPSDDFFVRLDASVKASDIQKIFQSENLTIQWKSSLVPNLYRVRKSGVNSLVSMNASLTALAHDPRVMYAEANIKIHRSISPIQTDGAELEKRFSKQWALNSPNGINPSAAWSVSTGSFSTKVAVIDTGVDPHHYELSDRTLEGYDFIDDKAGGVNHGDHGTHVSGIIGGAWNGRGMAGINEKITILPIRAVPDNADETDADLIESFEYAVAQGARVANCSFGKEASSQAVGDVIAAAGTRGLLVVVAAGNENQDLNEVPSYPASFKTSNMIVVGATHELGGLANFSNYGVTKVDIAAPGASIYSSIPNNRFASWDGTSMATPQVVGAAALILSARPDLTTEQLKSVLLSTARPMSKLSGYVDTGLLDLSAAMTKALSL